MTEGNEGRRHRGEYIPDQEQVYRNAEEQLELRLVFAEAVAAKKGITFGDALRNYTDVYKRAFGSWPGESEETDRKWELFVEEISRIPQREEQIQHILELFRGQLEKSQELHSEMPYWPFRYDYEAETKTIEMHFGTMSPIAEQSPDEPGILSKQRFEEQREKLRHMFREIKEKYPDAQKVRGSSWLYSREAYRRLYPSSYTSSRVARKGGFRGGGRWGQFRDKTGGVNPEVRKTFLQNIEHLDPENLEAAFPNQSWDVEAPIQDFYAEYGIT